MKIGKRVIKCFVAVFIILGVLKKKRIEVR